MSEHNIMRGIMIAVSKGGARFFRNNVGMGWVGKSKRFSEPTQILVKPGDVVIRQARPLHAGLCEGSGDLIGWTPVVILAEHVGMTLPVFSSIEVKSETGSTSEEQNNFSEQVIQAGGIAGVARSDAEALALLEKYKP
ncbi:VRR-NUC domain-containing protein [Parvibaculum sp.]|jgi:hypothetical protein|uniref:VRR-NUC domain-containing protein n=1 Tax=Parvibaculum sp. TaxID=2024848 RepID=UPI0027377B9E|nr:VRR-NUC domain-containing protein [Parvibaculum sp.]MDP3328753.1 VRR-NUC domain-containing protein [Parvibaculum sp.]